MYPIIFEYNGLVISSYGLMLMLAFIICNYLLKKYLISINVDGNVGDDLIFYAALGGILGAKIYYIIEGIPTGEAYHNLQGLYLIFKGLFTLSFSMIANGINQFGSGLVFLGGLMGGMISVTLYIKKNKLNWFLVSDWVAPYLVLGHCIGRIGCFLVGDCYGKPCDLPWSVSFPEGLPPTTYETFQYMYPQVFNNYVHGVYLPNSLISVHPTQLYESALYFCVFIFLLFYRKSNMVKGMVMVNYLALAGLIRFLIEFIRLNPKYLFGLSGAQLISIVMILSAFMLYKILNKNYFHKTSNDKA